MFLRFHGLTENGVAPAVLLFHGARRLFHIIKSFRLHGSGMRNDAAGRSINLQDRAATGTSHIKVRFPKIG